MTIDRAAAGVVDQGVVVAQCPENYAVLTVRAAGVVDQGVVVAR